LSESMNVARSAGKISRKKDNRTTGKRFPLLLLRLEDN
jgi:hypothetical protein